MMRGFTLIEALVALIIMGLMAAVAFPRMSAWYAGLQARQEAAQVLAQLRQLPARAVQGGRNITLDDAAKDRRLLEMPLAWQLALPGELVFLRNGLCVPGTAQFHLNTPQIVDVQAHTEKNSSSVLSVELQVLTPLCEMEWRW